MKRKIFSADTFIDNNAPHTGKVILVTGGLGFVGRYVVKQLIKMGYSVKIGTRNPHLTDVASVPGTVGQSALVKFHLQDIDSMKHALQGVFAVVNTVGFLTETKYQKFNQLLAGTIELAKIAREQKVKKFVHLSTLIDHNNRSSQYTKCKVDIENELGKAFPGYYCVRPSVIYGPEDDFFNRYAQMAAYSPIIPSIGSGNARLEPVFVGDVATAVAKLIDKNYKSNYPYELGGDEQFTLKALLKLICKIVKRDRLLVRIPNIIIQLSAMALSVLPSPALTKDLITLVEEDRLVSDIAKKNGYCFTGLGITPANINSKLEDFLYIYRPKGEFNSKKH